MRRDDADEEVPPVTVTVLLPQFARLLVPHRSRFAEDQIIGALRAHEAGGKAAKLCRRCGIIDAKFYNWKTKTECSGMIV